MSLNRRRYVRCVARRLATTSTFTIFGLGLFVHVRFDDEDEAPPATVRPPLCDDPIRSKRSNARTERSLCGRVGGAAIGRCEHRTMIRAGRYSA